MLESKKFIFLLIDCYGGLLTKNQQETLFSYFDYDVSLSEIATDSNISKQAVKDTIDKSLKKLRNYESELHLAEFKSKLNELGRESLSDERFRTKITELLEIL